MELHWESSVFAVISILILLWFLNKFVFKSLFGVMEKRRTTVISELQNAKDSNKKAEDALTSANQALEKARTDAYAILEQTRLQGARQADELFGKAKDEIARMKNEAASALDKERENAIDQLRAEVADISVLIASKVLEKEIDPDTQRKIIESELTKVAFK